MTFRVVNATMKEPKHYSDRIDIKYELTIKALLR